MTKNVLIIGSGPAGCTAAIYATRAGYNVQQILGQQIGGQILTTTDVENYPGFNSISGPDLATKLQEQAKFCGAEQIYASVVGCDFLNNKFSLTLDDGKHMHGHAVIIATGASAKWLNIKSEDKFKNHGVSGCATCDGYFYKNKHVAVIGGGNTAVEEALFLSNFTTSVTLIHRRDTLRAEKIMQERLFANSKIQCLWNNEVMEILGEESPKQVTGLLLKNSTTSDISQVSVSGVFIAIGHNPQTSVFQPQLELDEGGYITIRNGSTGTSVNGVFAAGDVQDKKYKQAITAAAQGCMAAIECAQFLENNNK